LQGCAGQGEVGPNVDEQYWDDMAGRFEDRVLEIAGLDQEGVIDEEIKRLRWAGLTAADLGCGPGSLLPQLSEAFVHVEAVDYSQELLDLARQRHARPNIRFLQADLIKGHLGGIQVDVSFCVNVLLLPQRKKLERIAQTVHDVTKPGGHAVFVVPSFESVLHVHQSLARARRRDGAPAGLSKKKAEKTLRKVVDSFVDGVIDISGVRTKHWTQMDLEGLLEDTGFAVERVRKVPFSWNEEIDLPPKWLDSLLPWDWLMVARRLS
jgi:SAM-dependent methyltransferase